jgi:hypothetical protein
VWWIKAAPLVFTQIEERLWGFSHSSPNIRKELLPAHKLLCNKLRQMFFITIEPCQIFERFVLTCNNLAFLLIIVAAY